MKTHALQLLEQARLLLERDAPDLPTLAARIGWSPAYLQKRFKQAYGLSPAEYLAQRRIDAFKQRLRDGSEISQAWLDSGYGSSSRVYEAGAARLGMLPTHYRNGGAGLLIHWTVTDTVLGRALVAATERGICSVALGADQAVLLRELRAEFPKATLNPVPDDDGAIADRVRQVAAVLAGGHSTVPVELVGTVFQHKVWQALMTIPKGQTRSYAELAEQLGMPKAARAVARACASNRVAILVPCHRVIRGDGSLGGYRWGLPLKREILAREAVA